jgi:hypothetical protein
MLICILYTLKLTYPAVCCRSSTCNKNQRTPQSLTKYFIQRVSVVFSLIYNEFQGVVELEIFSVFVVFIILRNNILQALLYLVELGSVSLLIQW